MPSSVVLKAEKEKEQRERVREELVAAVVEVGRANQKSHATNYASTKKEDRSSSHVSITTSASSKEARSKVERDGHRQRRR